MKKYCLFLLFLSAVICFAENFTDSRDGQVYGTITIGKQVWMTRNLNYPVDPGEHSWCYNDNKRFCDKYGRLYDFEAAKHACPEGWHLPSLREITTLEKEIGENFGKKVKATSSWAEADSCVLEEIDNCACDGCMCECLETEKVSGNGIDSYQLSILPAGHRDDNGKYESKGITAIFWVSEEDDFEAWYLENYSNRASIYSYRTGNEGYSVRCLLGKPHRSTSMRPLGRAVGGQRFIPSSVEKE